MIKWQVLITANTYVHGWYNIITAPERMLVAQSFHSTQTRWIILQMSCKYKIDAGPLFRYLFQFPFGHLRQTHFSVPHTQYSCNYSMDVVAIQYRCRRICPASLCSECVREHTTASKAQAWILLKLYHFIELRNVKLANRCGNFDWWKYIFCQKEQNIYSWK